jgi:hypothetical protein
MQACPAIQGYKIGAVVVGILLAVVFSGVSVSEGVTEASEHGHSLHQVAKGVTPKKRVITKKAATKTPTKKPVLFANITVPKKATSTLLAVVDQPSFTEEHRVLSDKVLRTLPSYCREHLANYYIVYQDAKQRGLGGKSTIILDGSVPAEEFVGLLVHECAHVTHGNMSGNATSGKSAFKDGNQIFYNDSPMAAFFSISWMTESVLRANAKSEDFVSGYAKSNAFEDFAETFAMYVLQYDAFATRAKTNTAINAKLQWMETYLPMPEDSLGKGVYIPEKKVPWDVTRLPFESQTQK